MFSTIITYNEYSALSREASATFTGGVDLVTKMVYVLNGSLFSAEPKNPGPWDKGTYFVGDKVYTNKSEFMEALLEFHRDKPSEELVLAYILASKNG